MHPVSHRKMTAKFFEWVLDAGGDAPIAGNLLADASGYQMGFGLPISRNVMLIFSFGKRLDVTSMFFDPEIIIELIQVHE